MLLRDHIELLVHLLLNQVDLICLQLALGHLLGIGIHNSHGFEIERTDRPHECLFQVFLHSLFHSVTLRDLIVGVI